MFEDTSCEWLLQNTSIILYTNANIKIEHLTNTISTFPALERVSIGKRAILDLNRLFDLKEVHLLHLSPFDSVSQANSLINLEQLNFNLTSLDTILPFIRHSKRLKTTRIGHVVPNKILDLFTLNLERKKLVDACKVVIYVSENAYLLVKWKLDNLNLDLVVIRRS